MIEGPGGTVTRNMPLPSIYKSVLDGKEALEQLWSEATCGDLGW